MFGMSFTADNGFVSKARSMFRPRDIFIHDGATMRRVHISARVQAIGAGAVTAALALSLIGTAQLTGAAPIAMQAAAREVAVLEMQERISSMRSDIVAIRQEAVAHATQLEQRQAFLDAVLTGKGTPTLPAGTQKVSARAADAVSPFKTVEAQQVALAARAKAAVEARYVQTAATLAGYGIRAQRIVDHRAAMGGPYEPVDTTAGSDVVAADSAHRATDPDAEILPYI